MFRYFRSSGGTGNPVLSDRSHNSGRRWKRGTANYEAFRFLTFNSRVRILAYLNVCPAGLATKAYHENLDPACFQKNTILRYLKKYKDQLLGLKLRSSKELVGEYGLEPLRTMISIAEEAHCPVVVHTTNPPVPPEELAGLLRAGDVYAHVYQGKGDTVVRNGHVIEEMREHQKRGVIFDAANGVNHFSLSVAQTCMAEGFLPDIISTDLTTKSAYKPGMVFSLPFILSKYIALGMPLLEIIRRVTTNPARVIGSNRNSEVCAKAPALISRFPAKFCTTQTSGILPEIR